MAGDILYAAVSLLLSVIFSGAEIAFLSSNKLQLEIAGREGSISSRIMHFFARKPEHLFSTSLLGNILSLGFTVYFLIRILSVLFPKSLQPDNTIVFVVIFIAVITASMIVLGYLIPKCWTLISPAKVIATITIPFTFCYVALLPFSYGIIQLHRFITRRILKHGNIEHRPFFRITPIEVSKGAEREDEHVLNERKIVTDALDFKTVKIRDCMIPRTEIAAVEIGDTIESLRKAFMNSGHSKIMIFRKSIDDIIGYCHSSSLFNKPIAISNILIPIITAPETTPANELMMRLILEKKSVAVVMDEFGGTAGIVSAEDIIDEVFGGSQAGETPDEALTEQKIDDRNFLFHARLEIEYLNRAYGLQLPSGDYDTLGGLILAHTENIPSVSEIIVIEPFIFSIQTSFGNRLGVVKLTLKEAENEENSDVNEGR